MKKIFHLSTCTTCQGIIKELGGLPGFDQQCIKAENISPGDLDFLHEKVGSYEALFSRRALKFRERGLHEKKLTESDYRRHILEEYTFLKRPVIVDGDVIFVGNAKNVVAAAKAHLKIV